ncbi:MAG: hypothetical protein QM692_23360, partial [Thermomicrobiales bacterium]
QGLLETAEGPATPALFPSLPVEVYPLYHLFADLAELRGGEIVEVRSDQPEAAVGLGFLDAGGVHILLANLTPHALRVVVAPWPDGAGNLRRLDDGNALQAMRDPAGYRREATPASASEGSLQLTLAPFATIRLSSSAG